MTEHTGAIPGHEHARIRRVFFGDVKWLAAVQFALRAKSLLILPFLTRYLGAADYGVWSQVAIITAFASPFINWGTPFGFIRRKAGTPIEERAQLFSAWVYALAVAFVSVLAIAMAASAPLVDHVLGSSSEGQALIFFAVLLAFSGALLNAEIAWLQLNGESRVHALVLLTQAILSLGAVASFLLIGGSIVLLAAVTFFADAMLVTGLFVRYLVRYGWRRPDFQAFWQAFRYGLPLMPMAFANIGINWVDRLVLLRFLSIADVGVYNLAHGIALMAVQTLTQPLRAYYPPRATAAFNAGNLEEVRSLYGLSAGVLLAIQVPAAIGLFFAAPAFLAIMAPPEFAAGAQVLPLLFLGYAIDRQTTYGLLVFEWEFRQHWVTITHYGCFALNLGLNFALVPKLGLIGAGIANLGAFSVRYLFVAAMIKRTTPIRGNPLFVVKVVVAGAAMGCMLWLLPIGAPGNAGRAAVQLAYQVAAGSTAYLLALAALGILPITQLRSFVSKVRPS